MNRDDIIRELGWTMRLVTDDELFDRIERIVRLAAAEEREACARLCETEFCFDSAESCAKAIRARGEA